MLKLCHKAGIIVRNQLRHLKITMRRRRALSAGRSEHRGHRYKLGVFKFIVAYTIGGFSVSKSLSVLALLILLFVLQPLAPTEELPEFRLGKEQARTYFKQGLVYLHNYQYNAARESFIAALAIMGDFKLAFANS